MNHDALIKFRVPSADRDAWQATAAAERMTLSAWIRRRCAGRPAAAPWPPPAAEPQTATASSPRSRRRKVEP